MNLFLKDLSGIDVEDDDMSRKAHGQVRRSQVITTWARAP